VNYNGNPVLGMDTAANDSVTRDTIAWRYFLTALTGATRHSGQ